MPAATFRTAYVAVKIATTRGSEPSGYTSSSQRKPARPATAGQYAIQSGSGRYDVRRTRPAIVRNGFASRQIGPQSSESGMMPTQIQTYSQVGAGFRDGSGLPNHAAPSRSASA